MVDINYYLENGASRSQYETDYDYVQNGYMNDVLAYNNTDINSVIGAIAKLTRLDWLEQYEVLQ